MAHSNSAGSFDVQENRGLLVVLLMVESLENVTIGALLSK
jgi:hypothetical protein